MRKLLAVFSAAFVLLAGCGGGSGTALSPTPPSGDHATGLETVRATIVLGGTPGSTTSAGVRRPKFISPSTNGIDIRVYAHGGNTIIGESTTDISSGSAACGGQTALPRTCTVSVPAPAGNDDFVATTYDASPANNTFAAAHALGSGMLNTTIVGGANNQLTLYISGIINQLGFLAAHASLPADGATHNLGFVLNPADFGNNPIIAGNNDPYANPIAISFHEFGGGGHVVLVKNGSVAGIGTTLNYSTDTIAVRYDGKGSPGYNVIVTVGAANVSAETLTISPLFVTSPSPYATSKKLTFTAAGQTAVVNLSETGAANTTTYTATPSGSCSGIATATGPSGTPSASSTTVTAGNNGSCTIVFSDGTSSITWDIVVTNTGGSISIPSGALGPIVFDSYSTGALQGQTDPVSGKPWLSNSCGGNDYDANVKPTSGFSAVWTGFTQPVKALQFSNAVTQNCYSGLGTPEGPKTSGYPNALTDTSGPTQCGPTCNPYFSFEFVATSSTGGFQPDLEVNFSPVFANNGARMAWVGLWHTTDPHNANAQRLLIFTNDVQGIVGGPAPCLQCANFVAHEVAYVDPALPHKIGLAIDFVQPGNDAVTVYVDGVQQPPATTIRSWEDYYLFDTESDPGYANPYSRAVDDVLFRAGNVDTCIDFNDYNTGPCNAASPRAGHPGHAANANKGFLITNVITCSGTAASCAGAIQTSSFARSPQSRSSAGFSRTPPGTFRTLKQVR